LTGGCVDRGSRAPCGDAATELRGWGPPLIGLMNCLLCVCSWWALQQLDCMYKTQCTPVGPLSLHRATIEFLWPYGPFWTPAPPLPPHAEPLPAALRTALLAWSIRSSAVVRLFHWGGDELSSVDSSTEKEYLWASHLRGGRGGLAALLRVPVTAVFVHRVRVGKSTRASADGPCWRASAAGRAPPEIRSVQQCTEAGVLPDSKDCRLECVATPRR